MSNIQIGSFVVEYCSTSGQRDEERRLRYGVFVKEYGYLPADHYPDGRETDRFDSSSRSFLVRDEQTGELAACARIIIAALVPRSCALPIQLETQREEGVEPVSYQRLPRHTWGEISRVTVAPGYRGSRVTGETATGILMTATIALAEQIGLLQLFSMSEPAMARLARPTGISMRRVGALVDYHGRRAPFLIETPAAAAGLASRNSAVYATLQNWAQFTARELTTAERRPAA